MTFIVLNVASVLNWTEMVIILQTVMNMTKNAIHTYMKNMVSPLLGMRTRMFSSLRKIYANRFVK